MTKVYRDYDQEALDLQYDNQRRVPDFQDHVNWYQAESARTRTTVTARLGLAYGASEDEYLDLYLPENPGAAMPVQVFFHGGYWRAFSSADFAFVATPVVAAGGISVVVNYALMPGVSMGELLRQCAASLDWVNDNIAAHGGDPNRIYISGHSAGGHIVAMMLARQPAHAAPVAGAVAVSGLYDLEPIRLCYLNAELHLAPEDVAPNSPLQHLPKNMDGPVVITLGADESEEYARHANDYRQALTAAGIDATLQPMAGRNHMTIVRDMGLSDSVITQILLRQMELA